MSPLRRLFIVAFWAAVTLAYVEAILPAPKAAHIGRWDKLDHMAAFFVVTFLARGAYPRLSPFRLFVWLAAFGAFIELSQAISWIHRDAEWDDWFADLVAIVAGLLAAWPIVALVRSRRERAALSR